MPNATTSDFANQVRRALTVLFILGGALVGGMSLALGLLAPTSSGNHLAYAAAGLGVSALATILKDSSRLLPRVRSYIVNGRGDGIYPLAGLAAALAITVTGFVWAFLGPSRAPDDPAPHREGLPEFVYVNSPAKATYVLPFFDEAKVCAADGICPNGVSLQPATLDFLEDLAKNIAHCGTDERPVELRVTGFASSSRFHGRSDSDELNLRVAHRRAQKVAQQIKERVGGSGVEIVTRLWDDHPAMAQQAGFKDTDGSDAYSVERGMLNRRVELTIVDPADCARTGFSMEERGTPSRGVVQDIATVDSSESGELASPS